MRDKQRKRLIKEELDKQLGEKGVKKSREKQESEMYEELQQQHLKLLEEREKEKLTEIQRKIMLEKESRDRQLYEEKHRKKVEEKDQFKQEVELVKRL